MTFLWWPLRRRKPSLPPQGWLPTPPQPAQPQRRYLENTEYLLPKDNEEGDRLDYQHHALHLALGNHYLAPLPPGVRTIVDVGTGSGIWPLTLAQMFSQSLVFGLDCDPALFHQAPPANCLLRAGNVLTGLPLPDQFADFTHQRFLVLAIPEQRWPEAIHELVRVTRAGGWLELVETDACVQAAGPVTTQVFGWIEQVRQARGLLGETVEHLGDLLAQEGLEQIETQTIPLRVGAWGGRSGLMMERDILAAVQALKEPCGATGIAPAIFEAGVQAMAVEWQRSQPFCRIFVAYGRRAAP